MTSVRHNPYKALVAIARGRERQQTPGTKSPEPSAASSPKPSPPRTVVQRRLLAARASTRPPGGRDPASLLRTALAGPGAPIERSVRERAELSLGVDLSGVRVHTGPMAAAFAEAVNARAYTVGEHIGLADEVGSSGVARQRTLAHELAHVVQQRAGQVDGSPGPGGLRFSQPGDRFERAADRAADATLSGRAADALPSGSIVGSVESGAEVASAASAASVPSAAAGTTIQLEETGLRDPTSIETFAQKAWEYADDLEDAPAKTYLERLVKLANDALEKAGVPKVECSVFEFDDQGGTLKGKNGAAHRDTWTIKLYVPQGKTVGDLPDRAALAGTVYHEARHCEQYFRIAQMQARRLRGDPDAPRKIKQNLKLKDSIITRALAGGERPDDPEAEAWEAITVGIRSKYKERALVWRDHARTWGMTLKPDQPVSPGDPIDAIAADLDRFIGHWMTKAPKDNESLPYRREVEIFRNEAQGPPNLASLAIPGGSATSPASIATSAPAPTPVATPTPSPASISTSTTAPTPAPTTTPVATPTLSPASTPPLAPAEASAARRVDLAVVSSCTAILTAVDALRTSLAGFKSNPTADEAARRRALDGVLQDFRAVVDATYNAYKKFAHEEDAYAAGDAAKENFRPRPKPGRRGAISAPADAAWHTVRAASDLVPSASGGVAASR